MDNKEPYIPTLLVVPFAQIIVLFFMGVALLNGEHALVLLTLLLLVTVNGARIWSRVSRKQIVWKSKIDRTRMFPGEAVNLYLHVKNPSWLPVWLSVGTDADGSFLPAQDSADLTQSSGLLWYQQVDFKWAFTAQRRGVYSLGAASMRIGDLFGFFPQDQSLRDSREVVVYPRLVTLKPIGFPRKDLWGKPGAAHPIHDPVYILGTREYHHSQPARFIHWKTSARYNQLHIKLFEPSRQGKILLMLDVTRFAENEAGDAFEQALEVMASFGVRLIQKGYSVGCLTNSRVTGGRAAGLPFSTAPHQTSAFLELLARAQMEASGSLSHLIRPGVNLSREVSCLYLTFQYDKEARAIAKILRRRHIQLACVVCRRSDEEGGNMAGDLYSLGELYQEVMRT